MAHKGDPFGLTTFDTGGPIIPVILRTPLNDDLLATGVRSFAGTPLDTGGKKFFSLGRLGIELATKGAGVATGNLTYDIQVNGVLQGVTGIIVSAATINGVVTAPVTTVFPAGTLQPGGLGVDLSVFPLDINILTSYAVLASLTGNFMIMGYFV